MDLIWSREFTTDKFMIIILCSQVVNVALGFVKSNLALTFFQVMSRVMVVVGVLIATPTGPASPGKL
jgi:Protein tyrosine phosphatase-like protein, PTPLA.